MIFPTKNNKEKKIVTIRPMSHVEALVSIQLVGLIFSCLCSDPFLILRWSKKKESVLSWPEDDCRNLRKFLAIEI